MDKFNALSDGSQRSVVAAGMAARGREQGAANNVAGFEKGGADRRAANGVVHAPPGEARNHVGTGARVYDNAKK
jgi:hypothetical protein